MQELKYKDSYISIRKEPIVFVERPQQRRPLKDFRRSCQGPAICTAVQLIASQKVTVRFPPHCVFLHSLIQVHANSAESFNALSSGTIRYSLLPSCKMHMLAEAIALLTY